MIKSFVIFLLLFTINHSQANEDIWFNCDNSPKKNWATYYCVFGNLDIKNKIITDASFGTCEGSQNAEESEPVTRIDEIEKVLPNAKLAATSSAWKKAIPFDFSNEDFGKSVLLIHEDEIKEGKFKARVKVENAIDGLKNSEILECRY